MEKLQIVNDFENKCCLCERPFKWRMYYHPAPEIGALPLKSFELITECATCRSLIRKRREMQDKLLGLEYEIWERKYFI